MDAGGRAAAAGFWLAVDGTLNRADVNCDRVYANGLLAVRWAKLRAAAQAFGIPASKRAGNHVALRKICSPDQTK
jgi:hypothetical protein